MHCVCQLRNTASFEKYVLSGIGKASRAAVKAVEEMWLNMYTSIHILFEKEVENKRRNALRSKMAVSESMKQFKRQKKAPINNSTDSEDSSEEVPEYSTAGIEDMDEFLDEETGCRIVLESLKLYCTQRLYAGVWISPSEQYQALSCSSAKCRRGYNFLGQAPMKLMAKRCSQSFLGSRQSSTRTISALNTLPPQTLLAQVDSQWKTAIEEMLYIPFKNHLETLKELPEPLKHALDLELGDILLSLQLKATWKMPALRISHNSKTLTQHHNSDPEPNFPEFAPDLPMVPRCTEDISPGCASLIMVYWKKTCEPLQECGCGICERQKRKRDEDKGASQQ
ncbi:hypothetical protein IE53DRAFT_255710 [Violaceomyces palustris]|uniref:Uncharacterized protein n=1 Tax=Violaceomyces palustris TaxID=1673888 RepID=A0ACD0NNI6_9BASI|nr:hypothetical protein IE53DRAFT_255710 [Violaceomyces palustris]